MYVNCDDEKLNEFRREVGLSVCPASLATVSPELQ